ncbi:MAG TPA: tetratricopeptide repeat protein [Anaerolineales bacterium]|nr:tetratricopeptide repeat protein [Anaerolineales bacterium]
MAKVSLRAYNREIEAMIDRSHLEEAIAHCQHILKTFPKYLEIYRLLGKAYLEAKKHNEAVDIFSRVLAAEPNDFVAHVGMSIIRDEQNKLDDAVWHMERAFEVQSANPAIQGELQRLYGRRDGVQPPRIRMTRGALAHMYMRGELYPQAISETKSVLAEDRERSDMQILLAKAYYRSGQKNNAADAASVVLKRYPYCLDANLVLADILNTDHPESAQAYRHRVIELDPYAAQAVDNMFRSNEVSDAAVSLEHMEWNGQPVGMSVDWGTERAISLESGISDRETQPDWLKTSKTPPSVPAFASEQDASSSPAQSADEIPDFLRSAGWGASTGAFDESKSSAIFDTEPAPADEPIAQGDLPDWVKAMAPQETSQSAEEQEEKMPDWIDKIGTGEPPVPSVDSSAKDQPDWLGGLDEPSTSQPSEGQSDWMKRFGEEEQPASQQSDEQPDWMKGFGREEQPASASASQPDWLKDFDTESVSSQPSGDFDFLAELKNEPEMPASSQTSTPKLDTGGLGTSEQEQDDSFAWLENLAAKQGATEGLLTKPEERLEEEPDWIKQAKSLNEPPAERPKPAPAPQPSVNVEELGKSGQEIDDALAWFESLAAKQGATEGLLTKPEERLEQEPAWVKQAKNAGAQQSPIQKTPVEEEEFAPESEPVSPVPQPSANVEGLGQGRQEIDDALAWFEGLAAKQGATEGLLTKPEERLEQEPAWVKQSKESKEKTPVPSMEMPPVIESEAGAEEFAPAEDAPSWLKSLDEPEEEEPITFGSTADNLPAWMQVTGEEEFPAIQSTVPMEEAEAFVESPAPVRESVSEDMPSWLSGLEEGEQAAPAITASDDLPAWMRDETGEVVAEPTKIEPTRASDWTPLDEKKAEMVEPPPPTPKPAPEPKPAAKAKKPAPKKEEVKPPAAPPVPYKEPVTRRGTGMSAMPVDPILGSARADLSRSNIPAALETYGRLIKKGRFLEEVIFDLREALYRYPVEVSIWQALGDAYMRANQLQDALDAYTKAEELLR